MIKKDIAYGINPETGNDVVLLDKNVSAVSEEKKELSEIDLIFQEADSAMKEQNQRYIKSKNKKHKKRRFGIFTKYILPLLVIIVLIIGYLIHSGIKVVNTVVPELRVQVAQSIIESRRELEKIDDEQLTVDEYYSKRVLLLLSEDEITNAVNKLSNAELFFGSQNGGLGIDDIIPPEKQAEYEKIKAEYEKAKTNEALSMIPSIPHTETEQNNNGNNSEDNSNIDGTQAN